MIGPEYDCHDAVMLAATGRGSSPRLGRALPKADAETDLYGPVVIGKSGDGAFKLADARRRGRLHRADDGL